MGRGLGKTEIRKIENEASRNASFRKRRRGLMKKAEELSILCDASVGVVVFSAAGKLSEYSNTSELKMIIERYMKHLGHAENIAMDAITEVTRLHQYHQVLEHEYRQMSGENLGDINLGELQELQDHLELGLKRVQLRQCELHTKKMAEIQSKGLELVEEHIMLRQQLKAFFEREEAPDEATSQLETLPQYKFL